MKELQHLNKYFRKYQYKILLGILITVISKVFTMFTPRFINKIFTVIETHMKAGTTDKNVFTSELLKYALLLIGTAVVAGILTYYMRQLLINVSRYMEFDLKNEIYQHYQKLSLNFYKKNRYRC